MKSSDITQQESTLEVQSKISIIREESIKTDIELSQVEKPLMRYFNLIDDVNESYVLGYN